MISTHTAKNNEILKIKIKKTLKIKNKIPYDYILNHLSFHYLNTKI